MTIEELKTWKEDYAAWAVYLATIKPMTFRKSNGLWACYLSPVPCNDILNIDARKAQAVFDALEKSAEVAAGFAVYAPERAIAHFRKWWVESGLPMSRPRATTARVVVR